MGFGINPLGIAGEILDLGTDVWKQDKAEDMAQHGMNFSAAQAEKQMQFQKEMRRTQYQTATQDMMKAGLNPMLAYHQGGAGTPQGAAASSTGGTAPGLHKPPAFTSSLTASQVATQDAQQRNLDADTDKKHAERAEIEARTPTHAVNIERMQQDIRESVQRIEKLQQDIRTGQSSAAHLDQQVRNLQETIPQIRAATTQLQTLAKLNQAQAIERLTASGLNEAHAKEILQKVHQDLPQLQRRLMDLERVAQEMEQPGRMADEAAKGSFVGQLGAYLKALLPLQGIFGSIPLGRAAPSAPQPGPIHRGTGGNPSIHRR